jgi:hypothetical protein
MIFMHSCVDGRDEEGREGDFEQHRGLAELAGAAAPGPRRQR